MDVPGPFALFLLSLGGFRLVRLIGWDTITQPVRIRLTGYDDDGAPTLSEADYGDDGRVLSHSPGQLYLSTLLRCAWCIGFWLSLPLYAAWLIWPTGTEVVMVPLTLSAAFGLVAKNLDP